MTSELYTIKNKIGSLSYAFTINGVELPVLDITHPLFLSSIDETRLKKMLLDAEKNAKKTAEKFKNMPPLILNFLAKRSFTMAELLQNKGDNAFLSGVSTLMLKLGPNLIGKGRKRFLDRLASKGIGGTVLRMRVRDISRCQASLLIPLLRKYQQKDLCMINIAGGVASDSINTLFLIQQEDPLLLQNRNIEINVLDIDSFGPAFAAESIFALKKPSGRFNGLDISFRHIKYDWNDTVILNKLLTEREEWLLSCSSEGGLFEYCSDEVIEKNLVTLYNSTSSELTITGSLLHDIKTVDPGIIASLRISTNIKPRFLGLNGLNNLCKNFWTVESIIDGNPRYLVFCLKKADKK
jgi:hypothetical protein